MFHAARIYRRGLIGALAILVAGTTSASAQTQLKLSDTITLRNGACWLVSDTTDAGTAIEKRETKLPRRCTYTSDPVWNGKVSVPNDPDETINFNITIKPDGTIVGQGREGLGPSAYSCTITGKTRPGAKLGDLLKVGAVIRVWELPSLP
jgi:hypothetical protein